MDYMNNNNNIIIACKTIEEELTMVMNEIGCSYPILWIESGLHLDTKALRNRIQQELDGISSFDRVFLGFGYCGNALIGLKTADYKVIFPRVDDCIALLLGSCEKRKEFSKDTYFLTEGWLNCERNIWIEYQETVKKYGKIRAEKIYTILLQHYKRLGIIQTKTFEMESFLKKSQQIAEELKLKQEVIPGTLRYIKKFLIGPWDEDFIIVNPNSVISLEHIYGNTEEEVVSSLCFNSNKKEGVS